jgi:hypothetical protein
VGEKEGENRKRGNTLLPYELYNPVNGNLKIEIWQQFFFLASHSPLQFIC